MKKKPVATVVNRLIDRVYQVPGPPVVTEQTLNLVSIKLLDFFVVSSDLEKTVTAESVFPLEVVMLQRQHSQVERHSSRICFVWHGVVTAEVPVKPEEQKVKLKENSEKIFDICLSACPYSISSGRKSPFPGLDSVKRELESCTEVRGIHQLISAGG